jgi:rod shape-determining protein MreC
VKAVRSAQPFKEILVDPAAMARGLDDVLILVEGVHQPIPDSPPASQPVFIGTPPPADTVKAPDNPANAPPAAPAGTEADKLRAQYKQIGDAQGHKFGEGTPGSKPPDFNLKLPGPVGTPTAAPPPSKPAVPPRGAPHP